MFAAAIKIKIDEWTVAGFFNTDMQENVVKEFTVKRLWLDPDKTYLCYDFWNEQFLGEVSKNIQVKMDPGSVTLLSFHEKKNIPQFLSTTRHVMQGAVEMDDTGFDPSTNTLYGVSVGPEGSTHSVIVYIPDNYQWSPMQNKLYDDFDHYTLKKTDHNILRIQLRFESTTKIRWKVVFEKVK